MNKLEQLHLDAINHNNWCETEFRGLHTYENEKSFIEINAEIVSAELAKITESIAIEFAVWLNRQSEGGDEFGDIDFTKPDNKVAKQLFDIFLKQKQ